MEVKNDRKSPLRLRVITGRKVDAKADVPVDQLGMKGLMGRVGGISFPAGSSLTQTIPGGRDFFGPFFRDNSWAGQTWKIRKSRQERKGTNFMLKHILE